MRPEVTKSGVTCMLQKPSVSWVTKSIGYTSNISANNYNGDRTTVLRYYIKEDESVFLDYKITQSKGEYVFKFNTSVLFTMTLFIQILLKISKTSKTSLVKFLLL